MPKEWQSGICNEKSGFLFSHACERLATSVCAKCEKPVCGQHCSTLQSDSTVLCVVCRKKRRAEENARSTDYSSGRRHRDDYYYDDPYYYGDHYYGSSTYGSSGRSTRRDDSYSAARRNDPADFTEADSENLVTESDGDFENDMSES